jgi:hypothetical protein
LSSHNATPHIASLGNRGRLTAATHAEAARIERASASVFGSIVAMHKPHGVPFDIANSPVGVSRYSGFLTASTMAVAIRDFAVGKFGLERARGTIGAHQKLPFWRLIRERFAVAARCFHGLYSCNCSTNGLTWKAGIVL